LKLVSDEELKFKSPNHYKAV